MNSRRGSNKEFEEKIIKINRVSKKTKGGNRIGFTALMVIGDKKGRVGIGLGKARDVPSAIRKGVSLAQKRLLKVPLQETTIPHEMKIKFGAAKVLMKPAPEGTGLIAGGTMRTIVELAGIRDIVCKSLGTRSKITVAQATILALSRLKPLAKMKGRTL